MMFPLAGHAAEQELAAMASPPTHTTIGFVNRRHVLRQPVAGRRHVAGTDWTSPPGALAALRQRWRFAAPKPEGRFSAFHFIGLKRNCA